ncbi:hypothetical protein LTR56_005363 [Elasticomyces elasticus]|nr:hypothetical protein LTR22_018676 [Elasticomyces elasticus]KAK3651857.1 hypothetical protein LTR56_005363 [Elasticomyces elasticus]KAK4927752.1 hypothetical protein LTR49_005375 [Elasticomyces elasticus]KAK5761423.1 hypothetical protein LTS12_008383 [Elasticomyces elasticus]
MARSMIQELSSDDDWSVASDESGMFATYTEPSQDLHRDHRLTPASQSHLAGPSLSQDPQDIRLIILDLSIDNYEPQLSYRLTNLGSPTPYYALSYAWGQLYSDNSHLDATVRLEGAPVKVTSRLHEALFQIRARAIQSAKNSLLASGAIALWIDALCIDQLNAVERNRQVSIMGDIFARAQAVLVWLPIQHLVPSHFRKSPAVVSARLWGNELQPSVDTVSGTALEMILAQDYFKRRWVSAQVVQEIVSWPRCFVLAGNYLMGLEMLQKAIVVSKHDMPVCFGSFTSTSVRVQTLLENMILHSELKCFDHRDRVFAMLAISADNHGIVPDYNVDYTEVYIQLAAMYLRKGWLLRILSCAIENRREALSNRMPSWVPDWRGSIPAAMKAFLEDNIPSRCLISIVEDQLVFQTRLYWLCGPDNEVSSRCGHDAVLGRIRKWRLDHELPVVVVEARETHDCSESCGSALCFPENESWCLLMTAQTSAREARLSGHQDFVLTEWCWFGEVVRDFSGSPGDLRMMKAWADTGRHESDPRIWFAGAYERCMASSELTSIVLV